MGCYGFRRQRIGWLMALAVLASCGCQTVKTPEEKIASSNIPVEFTKVSMPEYVVELPRPVAGRSPRGPSRTSHLRRATGQA